MAKKAAGKDKAKAAKVPETVEEAAKAVAKAKAEAPRVSMWRKMGEAYRDGYSVGRKGKDDSANPFNGVTEAVEWGAWFGGHTDGMHAFATKPKREPKAEAQEEAVA